MSNTDILTQEQKKKNIKKVLLILIVIVAGIIMIPVIYNSYYGWTPEQKIDKAIEALNSGDEDKASKFYEKFTQDITSLKVSQYPSPLLRSWNGVDAWLQEKSFDEIMATYLSLSELVEPSLSYPNYYNKDSSTVFFKEYFSILRKNYPDKFKPFEPELLSSSGSYYQEHPEAEPQARERKSTGQAIDGLESTVKWSKVSYFGDYAIETERESSPLLDSIGDDSGNRSRDNLYYKGEYIKTLSSDDDSMYYYNGYLFNEYGGIMLVFPHIANGQEAS